MQTLTSIYDIGPVGVSTLLTMLRRLSSLRFAPLQLRSLPSSDRDICRASQASVSSCQTAHSCCIPC